MRFLARAKVEVVGPTTRFADVPRDGLAIGRNPSSDLLLDTPSVSARHARIYYQGDDVFYEDLKSKFGTHRDGQELRQPALLRDGDEILLGGAVLLRIHILESARFGASMMELSDTQHSLHASPREAAGSEQPFALDLLPIVESFFPATSVEELAQRIIDVAASRFDLSRVALLELDGPMPASDDQAQDLLKDRSRYRVLGLIGTTDPSFVSRTVLADTLRRGVACYGLGGGQNASRSFASAGATSAIAAVVRPRDGRVRVLYLDTVVPKPALTWSHASALQLIAAHAAGAFDALRTQLEMADQRVRFEHLRRFFSPAVAEHLLTSSHDIRPQVTQATVLFADLTGYTQLSERLQNDPVRLLAILNRWLDAGARAVLGHGGTLDKFIGDAIMAVFGVPLETPDSELRAVRCALEMKAMMAPLTQEIGEWLDLTVGINSGQVVAGTMGSKRRLEYTVLGDTVNVASRLQGRAERGQILVGAATAAKIEADVVLEDVGLLELKNHAPVQAFRALRMRV